MLLANGLNSRVSKLKLLSLDKSRISKNNFYPFWPALILSKGVSYEVNFLCDKATATTMYFHWAVIINARQKREWDKFIKRQKLNQTFNEWKEILVRAQSLEFSANFVDPPWRRTFLPPLFRSSGRLTLQSRVHCKQTYV